MGCCDPMYTDQNDINGECPDCGCETVDGESAEEQCHYSPVVCETCGDQPCDQSC